MSDLSAKQKEYQKKKKNALTYWEGEKCSFSVFLSLALCMLCDPVMSMCAEALFSMFQTRGKL